MSYPASKQDPVAATGENDADDNVRSMLDALPDEEDETPAAVNKGLGGMNDEEGQERRGERSRSTGGPSPFS
ncbi:DUF2795 domain-containing protein [Deinococcus sp. YIM 134068]|uniref:DUF2795 domain-containing protein n=1 Tax=Deinococcus lichenicola TaxID=3118910 RepID=UPI002F94F6DE